MGGRKSWFLVCAVVLLSLLPANGANAFDANALATLTKDGNCRKCDLSKAALANVKLTWSDLAGANLTGANLSGANLTGANLTSATLASAIMSRANLTRAALAGANASGANLRGANLTRADLTGTDLTGADLTGATWVDGSVCGGGSRDRVRTKAQVAKEAPRRKGATRASRAFQKPKTFLMP